jgi:hypothetical protein
MASHRLSKDFVSPTLFFVRIIVQEDFTLECLPLHMLESLECIMRTIISMYEFYGLIRLNIRHIIYVSTCPFIGYYCRCCQIRGRILLRSGRI